MAHTLEHRAEAVFDTLLALPTVDRRAAAAAASGPDAALLARVRHPLGGLAEAADGFLSDADAGGYELYLVSVPELTSLLPAAVAAGPWAVGRRRRGRRRRPPQARPA